VIIGRLGEGHETAPDDDQSTRIDYYETSKRPTPWVRFTFHYRPISTVDSFTPRLCLMYAASSDVLRALGKAPPSSLPGTPVRSPEPQSSSAVRSLVSAPSSVLASPASSPGELRYPTSEELAEIEKDEAEQASVKVEEDQNPQMAQRRLGVRAQRAFEQAIRHSPRRRPDTDKSGDSTQQADVLTDRKRKKPESGPADLDEPSVKNELKQEPLPTTIGIAHEVIVIDDD
jgi:hypothetical protein